jgi:hypothetical protein
LLYSVIDLVALYNIYSVNTLRKSNTDVLTAYYAMKNFGKHSCVGEATWNPTGEGCILPSLKSELSHHDTARATVAMPNEEQEGTASEGLLDNYSTSTSPLAITKDGISTVDFGAVSTETRNDDTVLSDADQGSQPSGSGTQYIDLRGRYKTGKLPLPSCVSLSPESWSVNTIASLASLEISKNPSDMSPANWAETEAEADRSETGSERESAEGK